MKDYFDQNNLDEFLNEMKANRTKPSKESGERKALRKAWTKKSRDRIFNHPSNMAHGMSMAQKKDAKSQGFSNVPQMQYYQKKKRAGLVARDGDEEQVDEGSISIKKYLRRSDAARKASSEYDKHSEKADTYWKIHNKLKPGSIEKREELAKKSSKARNDSYNKIDKVVKKRQFKDNEKKQKQDVDEGSLGAKRSGRMVKSKNPSVGAAGAEKSINRNNKKKFMKRKRENLPVGDNPDAQSDRHSRLNRAADSRRTAQMHNKFGKDNFWDKADAYADLDRAKKDRGVKEGSLGQKKVDRLYQAQGKALDAYSADRNPENKAKFRKAAKDTYRKASARLSKIRLKKKDKE